MSKADGEPTYPLRAAARLTGLSPELLRAWERRYGAVEPVRTPGGTRRYRAADLEHLRRLKAAVDAGYRIGEIAGLSPAELERIGGKRRSAGASTQDAVLDALVRLDAEEAQRLLSLQLSALGPVRFAREFALPLAREVGDRWAAEKLGIASEHLGSSVLRSLLGASLVPAAAARLGPKIVFATLSGERHELGLQMAALTAMGAGAHPVYLGADLPVEDLLRAVAEVGAAVLALSIVSPPSPAAAGRALAALRGGLPASVRIWVGGAGSAGVALPEDVEQIADLEALEQRVALLAFEPPEP